MTTGASSTRCRVGDAGSIRSARPGSACSGVDELRLVAGEDGHGLSFGVVQAVHRSLHTCPTPPGSVTFPPQRRRRRTPDGAASHRPVDTPRELTQEHREKSGFETRAIHAGYEPDPTTGAVIPPIYATITYKQDGVGGLRGGYEYSRSANPTRTALEGDHRGARGGRARLRVRLRPGRRGHPAPRRCCDPGDHVVIPDDAYGGTLPALRQGRAGAGAWSTPRPRSPTSTRSAPRSGPARPSWSGSRRPTNPLLNIADIEALADVAHDAGALLVVDNTFASPYLQQPLTLGADVVVHSTTKYCGGHSDVVGGALVVRDLDAGREGRASTRTPWARSPARSTPG